MVSERVTRWENREAARAASGDGDGRGRDVVGHGEAAARRAHAMRTPHARVRTAGTAGRGIDSPPFSNKERTSEEPFSFFSSATAGARSDERTMSFSSCVAAFTLVDDDDDGGGFLGRGWALWCTRGAARSAESRGPL